MLNRETKLKLQDQVSLRGTASPFGELAQSALQAIEYLEAEITREREITAALTYAFDELKTLGRISRYQTVIHYVDAGRSTPLCNGYGAKNTSEDPAKTTCRRCIDRLNKSGRHA